MNAQRVTVFSSALLAIVAVGVMAAMRVRAESDPGDGELLQFVADGFQPDDSSPLVLRGSPIGQHAIWHRVFGPVVGDVIGGIPGVSGPPSFDGADCRAEYSQDEIVVRHRGILSVNVWGFRCEPRDAAAAAAGAHSTNGLYSVQGGTGQFQNVIGGTGSIQIDARSDGSVSLRIFGGLRRVHDSYRPF
jgi:hypothetical protein